MRPTMRLRVYGLGFRVQGLGLFRLGQGLGFGVRVQDWVFGCRVWGLGLKA